MHRFHFNVRVILARDQLICAYRARRAGSTEWEACHMNHAAREFRRALSLANAMRDRKRQALCLKILNWLRADLRRLSA